MTKSHDAWNTTYYHRAIRTRIGEALRTHLDQEGTPLPHRLFTLLMQLNEQESSETKDDKNAAAPTNGLDPPDRHPVDRT